MAITFFLRKPMTLKRDQMQRRSRLFLAKSIPPIIVACASIFASAPLRAEPVTNRVLSGYQVAALGTCTIYKINFNFRIRYVSHFPVTSGTALRIMLEPIDRRLFVIEGGSAREALRPPQDRASSIQAIQYEARIAEGPTLTILFDRPMNFDATQGADFQSLVVSLSDPRNGKACKPLFPGYSGWEANSSWGETVVSRRAPVTESWVTKRAPAAPIPDVPETKRVTGPTEVIGPTEVPGAHANTAGDTPTVSGGAIDALIAEARTALKQNNLQLAIAKLKKAVQLPENSRSPEARELLGVAYQKDKQPEAAKAVYQDYLHRYPSGEGTMGVKQRLMAMETADAPPSERLRVATIGPTGIPGSPESVGPQSAGGRSYWSVSGSLSTTYIRDDSYSVNRDPTQALNLNSTQEDHQTHQNTVLSAFDLSAVWGDGNTKSTFRFSGTEQERFGDSDKSLAGVNALYLDTSVRDWNSTFRIGRQSRNTGGVLGRFDGAVFSYQYNPLWGFSAVGGSPVEMSYDMPFKEDRYFYGGSINFGPYHGFDGDVYAIEQRDRTYLDRQAIGTELRYNDFTKSAFVTIDYDTHFNEIDAAIFTGTWTMPDKSIFRVAADYRKAPYLTTWNAIQGSPYATLYDLLKVYTQAQVQQMALDRTSTYQSSTVGYTRQITDKIQLNLDATQAHIGGTISSYLVNGTPDMGDEYYYGAQLVGNSLFTDGDLYTASIRYSDLKESQNFAGDVSARYPITQDLRVQPRFVGGYTTGKNANYDEYTVLPSLLIDYFWQKDVNFEVEVGNRWTWRTQGTMQTNESEFLVTAGIRWDFYADETHCLTPSVFCREASTGLK